MRQPKEDGKFPWAHTPSHECRLPHMLPTKVPLFPGSDSPARRSRKKGSAPHILCFPAEALPAVPSVRPAPCPGRNGQCPVCLEIPQNAVLRPGILLVEQGDDRLVLHSQLAQRLVHHTHVYVHLGIGGIHHVQNDVRVLGLLQGALERFNEVVGSLRINPTVSVSRVPVVPPASVFWWWDPAWQTACPPPAPRGQGVEQGGFSCVGIVTMAATGTEFFSRSPGHLPVPLHFR